MKFWIRKPSIEYLWLKLIKSPNSVTAEEKAKLLSEGNLQLAKILLEPAQIKNWTPTMIVIYFSFIWLMIAILAIAVGLNAL